MMSLGLVNSHFHYQHFLDIKFFTSFLKKYFLLLIKILEMSEILLNDPGTISSAFPNLGLFPLGNEKQNANFELGVSMVVHMWPTLKTAVDNQWGGANSEEKRDWISGVIVSEFENNSVIDIIYIHEVLTGILEDEFDTILEDGSTITVAEKIINVYNDCKVSKFEKIQALYNKWLTQNKTRTIVNVEGDPMNPDSDEELDGEQDYEMDIYEEGEQQQPPANVKQGPIIDDDGFTVVAKGRR